MNQYIEQIYKISKRVKYVDWYVQLMQRAITRASKRSQAVTLLGYVEGHHILPKSFNIGGDKDSDNLCFLTAKEHYIAHLLLTKMFTGKYATKMNYAFRGLLTAHNKHQQRYTSHLYHLHKTTFKWEYTKVYLLDSIKYVHNTDIDEIQRLLDLGWSTSMTPEYKKGRVGNMKGKVQSDYQRSQMSKTKRSSSKYINIYFLDICTRVDVRASTYFEYIEQGWSVNITPEYRTARAKKSNEQMSKASRQKAGQEISKKFQERPILTCPYCGIQSKNTTNMNRWHFHKCKRIMQLPHTRESTI